jgi:bifunctional UDP-N-acetylglucosamine pyrophosphorylase/glucosamine-1-phosphate N-acetyltransferase
VPAGALALGRGEQVIREGVATKLFNRLRAKKAREQKS